MLASGPREHQGAEATSLVITWALIARFFGSTLRRVPRGLGSPPRRPPLERLAGLVDRPAVRAAKVRAAEHSQEPAAQMALHPLTITNQLPDAGGILGPVGEASEGAPLSAHAAQYRSHKLDRADVCR
jgi:hypothetical protein